MPVSISNLKSTFADATYRFDAIAMNAVASAYAVGSNLLNLKKNGVTKFAVDVDGNISGAGSLNVSGQTAISGNLNLQGSASISNSVTANTVTTDTVYANTISQINTSSIVATGSIKVTTVTANTISTNTISLTSNIPLSNGGTGASLSDPNANRILHWNDTTNEVTWLAAGNGLAISANTLTSNAGMMLIRSGSIANSATLNISLSGATVYRKVSLMLTDVLGDDFEEIRLRFSTDGGTTFVATNDYDYSTSSLTFGSPPTAFTFSGGTTNHLKLTGRVGGAAVEGASLTIELTSFASATRYTTASWDGVYYDSTTVLNRVQGFGALKLTQDTDAVQIFLSTGTLTSGSWALYGYV